MAGVAGSADPVNPADLERFRRDFARLCKARPAGDASRRAMARLMVAAYAQHKAAQRAREQGGRRRP